VEENNLVLAVTGVGETNDRERPVIEDEMDKLRMGGYPNIHQISKFRLARKRRGEMYSQANHKSRWYH